MARDIAKDLEVRRLRTEARLRECAPLMQIAGSILIIIGSDILNQIWPERFSLEITEGNRGQDLQKKYKAEGKSDADFGLSAHNYGIAIDLAAFDIEKGVYVYDKQRYISQEPFYESYDTPLELLSKLWKGLGGTWGGDWKLKNGGTDEPHFHWADGLPMRTVKEMFEKQFDHSMEKLHSYFLERFISRNLLKAYER